VHGGCDRSAEDAYSSTASDPTIAFVWGQCCPTLDFAFDFWTINTFYTFLTSQLCIIDQNLPSYTIYMFIDWSLLSCTCNISIVWSLSSYTRNMFINRSLPSYTRNMFTGWSWSSYTRDLFIDWRLLSYTRNVKLIR
jgi:hypothetical protein